MRLQLVHFVLHSFQAYHASVFVLLTSVRDKMDKIMRSYLWRDKEDGRGCVKVAWTEVCLPFKRAGLLFVIGLLGILRVL